MTASGSQPRGRLAGVKRALRPLRPILGPPWRLARRVLGRDESPSAWTILERGQAATGDIGRRLRGRPPRRLRPLRRYELLDLGRRDPYYRRRVTYMAAVGRIVGRLIDAYDLTTALELGPHLRPLVVGADVMELEAKPGMEAEGRQVIHDATIVPWPIADRAYDLFVGLQVFEHLRDRQPEAFLEVRRVARHAVLSLPIDWEMPDPTNIHHRLSHERVLGWFLPVRPTAVVVGNTGPRKRLIYVFENLPTPGALPGEG